MKRRKLLYTLAGLPAASTIVMGASEGRKSGQDLSSPYENIDWEKSQYLHSMSHQHQGLTNRSRDVFYAMGYRHFAFSNYYPSAPTVLPEEYAASHPDLISSPNAEHGSLIDAGLHCNSLGSRLALGGGRSVRVRNIKESPLVHQFEAIGLYSEAYPWKGIHRLEIAIAAEPGVSEDEPAPTITVDGAVWCESRGEFAERGPIRDEKLQVGKRTTFYLRAMSPQIDVTVNYDDKKYKISECRLMQGSHRPWRDVFRAALDGEIIDGEQTGGLVYPDGGGITLNHPTGKLEQYEEFLDFDPRVLGIEVWNQLTSGFGTNTGLYAEKEGPTMHFYELWDDLLRTGRRCWGFFVKDHSTYGRGRNVLLVPKWKEGQAREEREADALRAYRRGEFFGSVAALPTNEEGEVVAPYDYSDFRFTRLSVRRDEEGRAVAVEVAVAGNDPELRPQVQIRIITDQGVAAVYDAKEAEFPLKRAANGEIEPLYVRVEAFAYPRTHQRGKESLDPETFAKLDVYEIGMLHDQTIERGKATYYGNPRQNKVPVPVVDMIFSQALRRV